MAHVEPAHLVELALGNDASSDDVTALRHIVTCLRCRKELKRLARVVAAARGVEALDLPTAPPDRVWQRITHELSRTGETASPVRDDSEAVHRLRPVAADERRTGHSKDADIRTTHLILGLLGGAAVIWWTRRVRSAKRPDRNH